MLVKSAFFAVFIDTVALAINQGIFGLYVQFRHSLAAKVTYFADRARTGQLGPVFWFYVGQTRF